jgi:hypothetical protein
MSVEIVETGAASAFGVALRQSLPSIANLQVNYTYELANYYHAYSLTTARFVGGNAQTWYFTEICSGIQVLRQ